jgi:predicted transport protein
MCLYDGLCVSSTLVSGQAEEQVMSGLGEEARLRKCSPEMRQWYRDLETYCLSLGKDVTKRLRVAYIGFWRDAIFAYVNLRTSQNRNVIDFRLPPRTVQPELGFLTVNSDDPRWVKIVVDSVGDVERAKPILRLSYQEAVR